jgi:predicted MPP superfamily phosphohydrolase
VDELHKIAQTDTSAFEPVNILEGLTLTTTVGANWGESGTLVSTQYTRKYTAINEKIDVIAGYTYLFENFAGTLCFFYQDGTIKSEVGLNPPTSQVADQEWICPDGVVQIGIAYNNTVINDIAGIYRLTPTSEEELFLPLKSEKLIITPENLQSEETKKFIKGLSGSDITFEMPFSNETWLDKSLLNYSTDNIVANENIIACEKYFPTKDFNIDGAICLNNELDDGYTLEVGCCQYNSDKQMIGLRSGWFSDRCAITDGAVYFRLCLRIKDSTGTYLVGIADELPLDKIFIVCNRDASELFTELLQNGNEIEKLKALPSYIDPETNILISDLADLRTLTIAKDYNGYYSRKPFNIVHCTDLHSSAGNVKCFANAIKLLESRDELDCMFLTGDLVSSQFSSDNKPLEDEWAKISKDVIFTVGNHDVGNDKVVANAGTDAQVYARYYAPHLKGNFMYDQNTTLAQYNQSNPSANPMMNYYVDYPDNLIRVISMYQYNTDFAKDSSDPTKLVNARCNKSYKQSDINWLINTLKNTPNGYTVLFITHEPEAFGDKNNDWQSLMLSSNTTSPWKKEGVLTQILTAYKKREVVECTVNQYNGIDAKYNFTADFTNAAGIFGAWILGHTHDDYVGKSINGEINIITKTCDNLHAQLSSSILRTEGTPNENTINIMSVDTEHRTITIKRIGAKFSRNGDWRNVTCLTY